MKVDWNGFLGKPEGVTAGGSHSVPQASVIPLWDAPIVSVSPFNYCVFQGTW